MKKIYNVGNHTIEFSEGSSSLNPWSFEYCKEINLSLAHTTDSVPYMRIDGEKIYNLRRSSCKYLDLVDCLESKAIVVTWEEVINNFDYLFDEFVGDFSKMKESLNELKRNANDYRKETQIIGEDYVSFETAKLLKEKGFLKAIDLRMTQNLSFYDSIGLTHNLNKYYDRLIQDKIDFVVAPTLQMAMKWLRKVHNLHIWVDYSSFDFNDKLPYLWNIMQTKIEGDYWGGTYHKSYEEAVEDAIKYCLENLI